MNNPALADESKPHPLTGLFFIAFKFGQPGWHGKVDAVLGGEQLILAQLYCWESHQPIEQVLVPISETKWWDAGESGWKFYQDEKTWTEVTKEKAEEAEEAEAE